MGVSNEKQQNKVRRDELEKSHDLEAGPGPEKVEYKGPEISQLLNSKCWFISAFSERGVT